MSTILLSLFVVMLLAVLAGGILAFAAVYLKGNENPIVDNICNLLPQTQCGQCGYPGCKPYAAAIAAGEANINQCPPGGQKTINELAQLLNKDPLPLSEAHGSEKEVSTVVVIREDACIGCTKCIQACPVDAIIGAAQQMHTVISHECTGCNLCIAPCPVDCIDIVPAPHINKINTIEFCHDSNSGYELIATSNSGGDSR